MGTKEIDYVKAYMVVSNYVNSRRWDTLAGRAWNMQEEESRQEFVQFLAKHLTNLLNSDTDGL